MTWPPDAMIAIFANEELWQLRKSVKPLLPPLPSGREGRTPCLRGRVSRTANCELANEMLPFDPAQNVACDEEVRLPISTNLKYINCIYRN
jgi:hypothetical protein